MMFPMVLPLPRTSISFGTGSECFLAHAGSASMASGLRAGGFPSKVTVPVMDDAAMATPGQTDIATSPAASHNLFPVTRMLGSLVIAKTSFSVAVERCLPPIEWVEQLCFPSIPKCAPKLSLKSGRFYHRASAGVKRRPRVSCT